MTTLARRFTRVVLTLALLCLSSTSAPAADGELRWGLHVTLASKWFDPAETEAFNTPFMVLYAVHDALVKPMPGSPMTPCLAESWSESKDRPSGSARACGSWSARPTSPRGATRSCTG